MTHSIFSLVDSFSYICLVSTACIYHQVLAINSLVKRDFFSLPVPFVVITIDGSNFHRTAIVKKTLTPLLEQNICVNITLFSSTRPMFLEFVGDVLNQGGSGMPLTLPSHFLTIRLIPALV